MPLLADLTAEELRGALDYEPDTGIFRWRTPKARRLKVGAVAGSLTAKGYRYIEIRGRAYRSSRLAWLYVTGEWPTMQIDHINCVRDDDRFENLREASAHQNRANQTMRSDNRSGLKGIYNKTYGGSPRWYAEIGKRYLGAFDTAEEAHAAYCKAATERYGEFARVA